VKSLLVIPSLNLLVSGSSDKIIRYWCVLRGMRYRYKMIRLFVRDLSTIANGAPLLSLGSISSHTRPVECLDGFSQTETSAVLCTADTMGVIKIWNLEKDGSSSPRWRSTLRAELNYHRTRINEMVFGNGQLWTGIGGLGCCFNCLTSLPFQLPPMRVSKFLNNH
jgi:WD40 repeat protein